MNIFLSKEQNVLSFVTSDMMLLWRGAGEDKAGKHSLCKCRGVLQCFWKHRVGLKCGVFLCGQKLDTHMLRSPFLVLLLFFPSKYILSTYIYSQHTSLIIMDITEFKKSTRGELKPCKLIIFVLLNAINVGSRRRIIKMKVSNHVVCSRLCPDKSDGSLLFFTQVWSHKRWWAF